MWNLFKKKKGINVVSPAKGKLIDLSLVDDEVFASKAMGDGFAIELLDTKIYAPVDGEIQAAFPTGHAFGILANEIETIVHVGIDTVNLEGKGFHSFVSIGDNVKAGDLLVELDQELLENKEYDFTTMVLFPNNSFQNENKKEVVEKGEFIGYAE